MAIIQRSGKVRTSGASPIVLALPAAIDPANSLIVSIASYGGAGSQSFSGSCGGTALAVAGNFNHPNAVGAVAVLYLVDPPSGQTSVSVQSTNNSGYYTAELIEVQKLAATATVNRASAATTAQIPQAGGSTTLTPNAGTTTAANAIAVTVWGASGTTASTLGSASPPSGYTLGFAENDDVNAQPGASAYLFLNASGVAVAPSWTITASNDSSQTTLLVGAAVVLAFAVAADPSRSGSFSGLERADSFAAGASAITVSPGVLNYSGTERADTLTASGSVAALSAATLSYAGIEHRDMLVAATGGGITGTAALLERADLLQAGATLATVAAAALSEPRNTAQAQGQGAAAAAFAGLDRADTLSSAALAYQSAVLSAALPELRDTFAAAAASSAAASAAPLDRDAAQAQAQAWAAAAAAYTEAANAVHATAQAPSDAAAAIQEPRDALQANLDAPIAGTLQAHLIEQADILTAASAALSLSAAVLGESGDARAAEGTASAQAQASLPDAADALSAQITVAGAAQLARNVLEAPDAFAAIATGTALAAAVLTDGDAMTAATAAPLQSAADLVERVDALAASGGQLPPVAIIDPRYAVALAARAFLATRAARAFLATRAARAFLAILRNGTTMTDTTEEKDRDESALITFDFDQALPTGVALTGAALVGVAPLVGTDAELPTWAAALQPQVGQTDAVLPTGARVSARRYVQLQFPAGAGQRGDSYKFRCRGMTADPAIAPICPVIVPVV